MPVAPKSFVGALSAFIVCSFTYTAYVARYEGNQIDAARTRWQDQMRRGQAAISGGATLLDPTTKPQ